MASEILQIDQFEVLIEGLPVGTAQEFKVPKVNIQAHRFNNGTDRVDDVVAGKTSFDDAELKKLVGSKDNWAYLGTIAKKKLKITVQQKDETGSKSIEHKLEGIITGLDMENLVAEGDGGLMMETVTIAVSKYERS